MARSDYEDSSESNSAFDTMRMVRDTTDSIVNGNTIHSGHFMVSCLTDEENDEDENVSDVKIEKIKGYDFGEASKEPRASYRFMDKNDATLAAGIETDLTKLFQCMTLAYSGKLTSPKWKNFKGLKLSIKDKVRLNNIIWREWHAQFVMFKSPNICQFEPPIADKTHSKPEAVVLEGKYWKRKLNSVTSEYKKWRTFHKKHRPAKPEDNQLMRQVASHAELLERVGNTTPLFRFGQTPNVCRSPNPLDLLEEEDMMEISFSDTLFSTLEKNSFVFPTPREISQLGNADIIQPGLIGLQPSIEDYMDTLEPLPSLQEMMGGYRGGRSSNLTTSMLVDPITDPFFNDSSNSDSGAPLGGVDFLCSTNQSPPGHLQGLLLDNSQSQQSPNSGFGQHQQQQVLSPQQDQQSTSVLNQHQTDAFNQPSQVVFSLHDSVPEQGQNQQQQQGHVPGFNSQGSSALLHDKPEPQQPDALTVNLLHNIAAGLPPNATPSVRNQHQQVAGSKLAITAHAQNNNSNSATNQQRTNQNAAAQLLNLIIEHNLGAPAVTSSGLVPGSAVSNSSPLDNVLATLRQEATNRGASPPSFQSSPPPLIPRPTHQQPTQHQVQHSTIAHLLRSQSTEVAGSNPGVLKGGFSSDTALVQLAQLQKQNLVQNKGAVQLQGSAQLQTQASPQLQNLLQGFNQPLTTTLSKRNTPQDAFIDLTSRPILTTTNTNNQPNTQPNIQPRTHQRHRSGGTGTGTSPATESGRVGRGRGRPRNDANRRASTGSVSQQAAKTQQQQQQLMLNQQEFKVPENPTRTYKQVKIAPAPKPGSAPSLGTTVTTTGLVGTLQPITVGTVAKSVPQNTFLAQLLQGHDHMQRKRCHCLLTVLFSGATTTGLVGTLQPITVGTAAKSVAQNTFFAKLVQGHDTAVPSIALKSEPSYPLLQPKPVSMTTASIATAQTNMAFSIATGNGLLLGGQSNTLTMAELLSASPLPHQPAAVADTSQFRVPSPAGSVESGTRSRHASSESVGSPALATNNTAHSISTTSIKEEGASSPGRPPVSSYNRRKTDLDPDAYRAHRRASHISAEQKRRFNIKYGFDMLCNLVPSLSSNPNAKVSKAAILQKAAEHARKLKVERARMHEEGDVLKQEIESLNTSIGELQSQLPATGVPVSGQRVDRMKAVFEDYVRNRTLHNWKYWIFSMIVTGMHASDGPLAPPRSSLFESYSNTVSTASMEEFCRTVLSWLDQHCSLIALRPAVLPSLTRLSTSTSILTDPNKVPEEATKAVIDMGRRNSGGSNTGTEIN